ncbi:putative LAP3-member of the GAL regulon [Drechmeria coniospora]|uniref:Cysteine proteinase 1, mitochondrial n=1 Tax=Drechmeria coniospora TaxID=98403 RepID=A0A151GU55_DRECN|nr:putative LAP3-member of the GAL regulon [Drechmeria coniospora]KYK60656.1 putative LAP3-member of the GAL regulon [Drechmeria coniospora]
MGGQPSKSGVAGEDEKAISQRLRSMGFPEEYDDVQGGMGSEKGGGRRPRRDAEPLPLDAVALLPSCILKDAKNRLALAALSTADPRQALKSIPAQLTNQQVFNIKIPFEGAPIANQRSSGRCWLFASTNVFRVALMKKYRLDSFELSQAYLFYWDKLEKANWFLEQAIDTADEELEGRLVQTLMSDPSSDGGQWDMVYNLVDKYGLVPQALYPDSWNAMNSGMLNIIVKNKLREFGLKLRKMAREGDQLPPAAFSGTKIIMLREIQQILTLLLGPPPNPMHEFMWQYNDKDGKAQELTTTPRQFAKNIASPEFRISSAVIESMVSLVHDPRHEPLSRLTVSRLGNIVGGRGISYINVDMDTLKSTCVKMIKAGLPIFFGCDVGKFSDQASGIMDTELFNYDIGLDTGLLGMTKAQRLRTGESQMTHAMVLTAVHVDEETGKPVRWRVQNSWGTAPGDKGWFVMSDAWADEFVYQAVVDPRFCSKEVRDVLKKEPIVLPLWDPMGALA